MTASDDLIEPYEVQSEANQPTSRRWHSHAWFGFGTSLLVIVLMQLEQMRSWLLGSMSDFIYRVGFPFAFFEYGGVGYHETFYLHWLLADVVIALVISSFVAYLLRDGWRVAFRRVQTWGLDHVESSHSPGTQE